MPSESFEIMVIIMTADKLYCLGPNPRDFPCSSVGKQTACSAGDQGSISGLGRFPGEGNGDPLHYSCLENPMDRGVWQATVHWVAKVGHDPATKPPPPNPRLEHTSSR